MHTFFPLQPKPQRGQLAKGNPKEAKTRDPIRDCLLEGKVGKAIFSSNPRKAPRPSNISF